MTDKQAVKTALDHLPENASLDEISEQVQIMAAVRRAREDRDAGRTKTHEEVKQIFQARFARGGLQ